MQFNLLEALLLKLAPQLSERLALGRKLKSSDDYVLPHAGLFPHGTFKEA
jgi:hypothetical protein